MISRKMGRLIIGVLTVAAYVLSLVLVYRVVTYEPGERFTTSSSETVTILPPKEGNLVFVEAVSKEYFEIQAINGEMPHISKHVEDPPLEWPHKKLYRVETQLTPGKYAISGGAFVTMKAATNITAAFRQEPMFTVSIIVITLLFVSLYAALHRLFLLKQSKRLA